MHEFFLPLLFLPAFRSVPSFFVAIVVIVISDVAAAAKAGRVPITSVLDVASHFSDEREYSVISSLTTNLVGTVKIHAEKPYFPELQRFIRELYAPAYARLGFEAAAGEDHITGLFRATVLSTLAFAGHDGVIAECKTRFSKFVSDPIAHPIRADIRSLVYANAVKHDVPVAADASDEKAGASAFHDVLKLLRAPDVSAEERSRLYDALGRTREPVRVAKAIDFIFGPEVRSQDVPLVFSSLGMASKVGREQSWTYLQKEWTAVYGRFKDAGFLIPRIVSAATSGWADTDKANEIQKFFETNPCPEADRVIKQVLETVRGNAARLARETGPLTEYFAKNAKKA